MILYVGGFSQGKLEAVCDRLKKEGKSFSIFDENNYRNLLIEKHDEYIVVNNLRQILKSEISEHENDFQFISDLIDGNLTDKLVIICEEIGNGIVPIDKKDREFRENYGRMTVKLAKMSDEVYRVCCGIASQIK